MTIECMRSLRESNAWRISDSGRAVIAEAWASVREPELYGDLETTTGIANRNGDLVLQDIFQEQNRTGRTLSLSQRLSMTQPLGASAVLEAFGERRAVEGLHRPRE